MQKKIAFLAAMLMMVLSSAMAQVTTSGINGKVTLEATGEDVIGATVQAVHVPSGTKYAAVTNAKGIYSIQGMRSGGPYTVTVSYIGAQTKEFENISLSLGESYNLKVWLADDTKTLGEVIVSGQAGVNGTRNGAAQTISNRMIQELPSINHSVADIARVNPFVKVTEGGAINIAGSNNRYNAIQIDGAMSNDVFGLTSNGANGGQAGTQPFSMETIDQLHVSIAPFDVRQSGFTGGAINAITKSGTNEFHGSVYSYFQNGDMVSNKYEKHDGKESADYGDMTDWTLGATLGGPIVKDKLFFFANFERSKKEYDNAFSTNNGMSKIDFDVANQILDKVRTDAAAQGVNYRGTLGTPKEYTYSDKVGLKLDWNINDRNHASLRWSFVDAKQNNKTASAKNLVTNDYAYDFCSKTSALVFELNSRIGDNMSNEFHASWTSVRDKRNPGDPFPMIQISNVGGGTLNIGNEYSSMANALDQDIYTLTDNFTINAGHHAITFGTHDEFYNFSNLFCQNLYGSYYFNNPNDFFAGKISEFDYAQGDVDLVGTKRWVPSFSAGQIGFYVQDKWSVTDNFDLTYGLRADMPIMFDTPLQNADFNVFAAQHGWDFKTNQKISVKPMWSPRLGFRWNALKNNTLIVRGGVGIFTGRVPFVWISNNFSNTGVGQMSWQNKKIDPTKFNQIQYDVNKAGQADETMNLKNGSMINVFNKDFKFSQQLRANLALDFKLLGINWTVEGIYSKTLNDMIVKNYSATATGKTYTETVALEGYGDNRPMFETKSISYGSICVLDNVSKGYSYSASVKAEKSFDFGLDLMASYTYGLSKTINNGSSSVAYSNWRYNYTHGNPNSPELAKSNFNIPHQVMVSAYQHINWNHNPGRTIDNKTTIGLIYTGNSGSPYSIAVNGDLNGDGSKNNDLMYIPTDAEVDVMVANGLFVPVTDKKTGAVTKTAEQQGEDFKQWMASEKYVKDHRGHYFERNDANEDWENRLDLHVDHKFGFKWGKDIRYIQIGLDIINFTNMLNKKWGATLSQGGYNYYSPLTYGSMTVYKPTTSGTVGKSYQTGYQFTNKGNYDMRSYSDYYSRWRMQLTAKLTF